MGAAIAAERNQRAISASAEAATRVGRRGRPATASRGDVLAAVTELYLAGQRVDVTVVAARLGLGRATIYRWFGSREALLGEVVAQQLELLVARKRAEVRRRGAPGLLEVLDRVNQTLTRSRAVRQLLEHERGAAMRMLTSSAGVVEPRAVACIQALIEEEAARGYEPPTDPETLAYALVHLRHAFLWNDATSGVRGDYARLRDVSAALLGIPPKKQRPSAARTPSGEGTGAQ